MTTHTTANNTYTPEVIAEGVREGLAARQALYGTGVAVVDMGLSVEGDKPRIGSKVTVPYLGTLTTFEEITTDGDALTPEVLTDSKEDNTIRHFGKAFETTYLGRNAGNMDKHDAASDLIVSGIARKIDELLIEAADNETSYTSYILDKSTKDWSADYVPQGRKLLGDEARDFAALAVHSATELQMRLQKTSDGNYLWRDGAAANGQLPTYMGIPVIVSDRLQVSSSVYSSLLLKRNSLIAWFAGEHLTVEEYREPLKDVSGLGVHLYGVVHRYKKLAGMSKPGVVIIKHK